MAISDVLGIPSNLPLTQLGQGGTAEGNLALLGPGFKKSGSLFGDIFKIAAPGVASVFAPYLLSTLAPSGVASTIAPTGGGGFSVGAGGGGMGIGNVLQGIAGLGAGGYNIPFGTPPFNPNAGGYPSIGLPGMGGGGFKLPNLGGMGGYGLGMGLNTLAAFLQARASNGVKMAPLPPPNPLFPGLTSQFTAGMGTFGPQSFSTLTDMAKTGMPVDYSQLFASMMGAGGRLIDQGRANLKEKYGATGTRFSSAMANAAVDYENQTTKDFANILAQLAYSSNEAARGRMMQAAGTGAGLFSSAGTSFTPSALPIVGGRSAAGEAIGGAGNAMQTFALLKMLGVM